MSICRFNERFAKFDRLRSSVQTELDEVSSQMSMASKKILKLAPSYATKRKECLEALSILQRLQPIQQRHLFTLLRLDSLQLQWTQILLQDILAQYSYAR